MFLKSPGFTALALATLALGIGANTSIFSVVNSVLLRPLPHEKPDRIVQIADLYPATGTVITSSFPKFTFLREHIRSFSAIAAVSFGRFQVAGPATASPDEIQGARVPVDFFRVLGAKPALGRIFLEQEDRPGGNAVAVISNALWQNRFGSDPATIGKTFTVDGSATTIIGVMPGGFNFPDGIEIWMPGVFQHQVVTQIQIQRGARAATYATWFVSILEKPDLRARHIGPEFADFAARIVLDPDFLVEDHRGPRSRIIRRPIRDLRVIGVGVLRHRHPGSREPRP